MKSTRVFLLCSAFLASAALAQLKPVEPQPQVPAAKPSAADSARQVQSGTNLNTRAPTAQAKPPVMPCPPAGQQPKKGDEAKKAPAGCP
ncbi:MAG TPA: hypothetical protein PLE54_11460 [Burkholderiaceae bacterium]|nr:hypothetical protein [Burkholderiaceae bacterium]HQR71214.1 hypothetical protein [Burkholderiaceae bacterium]